MLFQSTTFLLFLALCLPAWYLLRRFSWAKVSLAFFSLVFYGWWWPPSIFLFFFSWFVSYHLVQRLHRAQDPAARKRWVTASIVFNLGLLGFFKYAVFAVQNANWVLEFFGSPNPFPLPDIFLPAGISFFTFEAVSYSVDVYRGEMEPVESILDYFLFLGFFPHLIAGPLLRAPKFVPQLKQRRTPTLLDIRAGVYLFIRGMTKKVLIADEFSIYVNRDFPLVANGTFDGWRGLVVGILFAGQVYYDFSGYTDMARGVAKFFGLELPINFRMPYLAQGFAEVWRRWHVSLSNWLRDYIYFSLGGNRQSKNRTYVNIMITFLLGGLWHGAGWNYVLWGGINGVYLVTERMWDNFCARHAWLEEKVRKKGWYVPISVTVTFALWILSVIVFRAPSGADAISFMGHMFTGSWHITAASWSDSRAVLLLYMVIGHLLGWLEERYKGTELLVWGQAIASGVMLAILYYTPERQAEFIYFQF